MHMADALISPVVGGSMWALTAGMAVYSAKKIEKDMKCSINNNHGFDEKKIPLMGVMGAFVFASQMINFTIPGTGSSGHIGGGILLAILLGPEAGFLTMLSVLGIQALFFADGGLLALGCNVINMGLFTCFIVYPLIYRNIMKKGCSTKKIWIASIISVVVALQLGSFNVVLETLLSGKTELPFITFVLLMQPIHLAIGFVEGVITACVVSFVYKTRPDIIQDAEAKNYKMSFKKLIITMAILTVFIGGGLSLVASSNPDGLEWSILNVTGKAELQDSNSVNDKLASIQEKTAFLPDYGFKNSEGGLGTSVAGVVGGVITLGVCGGIGMGLKAYKKKSSNINQSINN
ncbi:energy-coupling factor ABC transporter permease [Romboutsia sp.]|uniref:energy-coupling factor ABC transporter permease n=1 Tax=Romboutsia sp. TaxID=1965302 RepID=UPI003F3C22CF